MIHYMAWVHVLVFSLFDFVLDFPNNTLITQSCHLTVKFSNFYREINSPSWEWKTLQHKGKTHLEKSILLIWRYSRKANSKKRSQNMKKKKWGLRLVTVLNHFHWESESNMWFWWFSDDCKSQPFPDSLKDTFFSILLVIKSQHRGLWKCISSSRQHLIVDSPLPGGQRWRRRTWAWRHRCRRPAGGCGCRAAGDGQSWRTPSRKGKETCAGSGLNVGNGTARSVRWLVIEIWQIKQCWGKHWTL